MISNHGDSGKAGSLLYHFEPFGRSARRYGKAADRVLTSGGDAPGMNAAIRAVVRTASRQGMECVGIRRGWHGLINSDFVRLDTASVSHTIDKGGTLLYTARSEEFLSPSGREKALATCKLLGLDGLVAIGGDGTFRGALALSRQAAEEHSPFTGRWNSRHN